jgi:arylformamidase
MQISISINRQNYSVNTSEGIDISRPIDSKHSVLAYHIPPPTFTPFCAGGFVGAVEQGGACNCEDITFNAHGNGTHTECVGHITKERITINSCLKEFHFAARLVSLQAHSLPNGDLVLNVASLISELDREDLTEALIIRTLPNAENKLQANYSGKNPIYLDAELTAFLAANNVKHLLLDLPSVDREEDGGALAAHKAFWQYPENTRTDATITELIYVPNAVADGLYLLNLQIASFESDASPSKPVLYNLLPNN